MKRVRARRNAPHAQEMRDRRGAEQPPAGQRQAVRARRQRHQRIAARESADVIGRGLPVRHQDNTGTTEADIVEHPHIELGQEGKRRDMLEMAKRDRGEEPVLGLAVKDDGPAPGLDAEGGDLLHDTLRIVLRRFHACTGAVATLPIVTALPSPPPRKAFSPASQMCEYWFFSGSSA